MPKFQLEILTILPIMALASISLLVIYSINKTLAVNQLAFWFLGLAVLYVISLTRYQIWQKYSVLIYLTSLASLFLVMLAGEEIRGSVRWISLGDFRFQPSEIAKVATVIMLAAFYSGKTPKNVISLVSALSLTLPFFILIFIQPDIGSALAIIAIWLGASFAAGLTHRQIIAIILAVALILPLAFNLLAPYQKQRLASFVNPSGDPLGAGYNIIQAKIAVGSGQLFGRGAGLGSQSQLKFLPEAQSDFIFAATVEQLGFVGGATIIGLFALLTSRLINGMQNNNRFAAILTAGAVSLLLYQFVISIGMNMGLIPVTGITLPLVSYGGSSLVSTLLLLGIVLAVGKHQY